MKPTLPIRSGMYPVVIEDRLNLLPDMLLHTIMSFLTAQQAVQTCVLSRRWVNLWCSMPCLDIDQQEFHISSSRESEADRFNEFVNNLLMFHNAPSLDRFRCHVTSNFKCKVVDRWIRYGIRWCPAAMEIRFPCIAHNFCELPYLGSSACRLKRLHLVRISAKSFAPQLSSGCPVLEDLKFEKCLLPPEIMSSTLTNLIVKDCKTYSGDVLTITAPGLISFHLVATGDLGGILVNEMPSLVKASICLKSEGGTASSLQKRPRKLLCRQVNVRSLQLSRPITLSLLGEGSDAFPTFCNLRTLVFDRCDFGYNFQILECFLNNAFTLEKLTLQYCKLPAGPRKRKRTENPKRITMGTLTFQCPNLKYKENDVHQLFGLLSDIWRNLRKTTIQLMKA